MRKFLCTVLLAFSTGCGLLGINPSQAREDSYAAITILAEAVKKADSLCADEALERKDIDLADKCAAGYTASRNGLLAAEEAIDAWDNVDKQKVWCAVGDAVDGLQYTTKAMVSVGINLPPLVEDAFVIASRVASACDKRVK